MPDGVQADVVLENVLVSDHKRHIFGGLLNVGNGGRFTGTSSTRSYR